MKKKFSPKTNLTADDVKNGIFFDNNPLPMWVYDLATYRFLAVNHAAEVHYGYSEAEFLSMTIKDIRPPEDVSKLVENVEQVSEGLDEAGIWRHTKKNGSLILVEIVSHTLQYEGRDAELVVAMDITERRRAEWELSESEKRFHRLAENAPDLIYRYEFAPKRGFTYVSPAASAITGYSPEEHYADPDLGFKLVHPDDRPLLEAAARGETAPGQPLVLRWVRKDGSILWTEQRNKPVLNEAGEMVALEGIARDITERKQAEEQIRASEDRYRDLVEHIHDLIGTHDLQGNILSINPAASKLLGMNHETIQKMNLRDLLIPEVRDQFEDYLAAIQKNGQASGLMYVQTANGGRRIWEYDNTLRLDSADGPIVRALARDVTERMQAENALRESEARYRDIFDGVQEAIFVESPDGRILEANQSACEIYGYTRAEFLAMNVTALVPEDYAVLTTEIGQISGPMETVNRRANGEVFPVEISGRVETINGEATLLVVVRDITERKQAEEKINLQLQRLSALKEIDRAISSNMDLHVSLDILLTQVLSQLGVDAASVLLLNTSNRLLEFAAGKGYRTPAIRQSRMRLGEGCAGQVGLERRVIHVPDLSLAGEQYQRAVLLEDEGFIQYFGVPLVAKGQLKGVLEVFQRSPLQPDAEWMHYLETLGGQAAIAIENAQMFEGLQQSNLELVTAYDATIAGWSHAMDLRDKETEGHTQRVTELTVQLAERMGLGTRQVVHIRRGALLHDIGKLGVPDSILLKAGKLTDEEWAIMRRHPALAYEMLSPIAYLKPALDIPYCHHEKWDGTGYPRGLKGEEIPLAARIFAVVDVWDAVTSDRPYRAAWSKEKAFDYIRAESGKHFDPEVVEAFLGKFEQG